MSQPNIVITFADDQRHTLLGCCDSLTADAVRTPHLDALANRGGRFTHAYHPGSPQGAVCVPNRGMLHTGCGPFDLPSDIAPHGLGSAYSGPNGAPLLGKLLRDAGYVTHFIGKWHNDQASLKQAFDTTGPIFFGGMASHFNLPLHRWDGHQLHKVYSNNCHSTEVFGEAARTWLERRGREGKAQPFFLCVAFTAPHDPRQTHAQWHARYPIDRIVLPDNFRGEHPLDNGSISVRDEILTPRPRDLDQTRLEIANYYAMAEHMDHGIGRIHQMIAQMGLQDNTLVIHSGDHGLAVGQHGLMGKQNLYDHSVRVPLILAGPNVPRGEQFAGLCYQHDLFPTLLEAAGQKVPDRSVFRSLWPIINGSRKANYDLVGSYYEDVQRMVTDGHTKVIRYRLPTGLWEQRFDLDADPWEQIDDRGQPLHASGGLGDDGFAAWQNQMGDPWLNDA